MNIWILINSGENPAGPGGLSAAIALSTLPFTTITIYDQASELREIGAGINIGFNCWKVLELLGVAVSNVTGHIQDEVLHRNGISGEVVKRKLASSSHLSLNDDARFRLYQAKRVKRTKLQRALIDVLPEPEEKEEGEEKGILRLKKRLVTLEDLEAQGGIRLRFEDGDEQFADLVVGADGIRSVVRQYAFPNHDIRYTGTTIWRVLIPLPSTSEILDDDDDDVTTKTAWWHGPEGHVYLSPVDDLRDVLVPEYDSRFLEISARHVEDPSMVMGSQKKYSWGVPATKERVESHFTVCSNRPSNLAI